MRIAWYPEDKKFVGICPEFPSISALGDTYHQAVKELEVVIQLAIETFEDEKLTLPKPIYANPYKEW
jgi:predicted RNase H-like HicB family nuclease